MLSFYIALKHEMFSSVLKWKYYPEMGKGIAGNKFSVT